MDFFGSNESLALTDVLLRMLAAGVLGTGIGLTYRATFRGMTYSLLEGERLVKLRARKGDRADGESEIRLTNGFDAISEASPAFADLAGAERFSEESFRALVGASR